MVTRMERYNNSLEDVKITKRSDKNKDLYEKNGVFKRHRRTIS